MGGPNPYEGRVEIYKSDVIGWASICEQNWDFQEAEVVCQTLDYRPATSISTMRYGLSSGPIVKCLDEDFRVESSQCQVISDADSSPLCSRDTVVDVVCSGTERGNVASHPIHRLLFKLPLLQVFTLYDDILICFSNFNSLFPSTNQAPSR